MVHPSQKHSHCSTLAALPVCIILIFLLTFLIGQVVVLVQRQLKGQSGTYDILGNGKMSHSMTSHSPDLIPVMVTFVAPKADRPRGLWPRSLVAVYGERISYLHMINWPFLHCFEPWCIVLF